MKTLLLIMVLLAAVSQIFGGTDAPLWLKDTPAPIVGQLRSLHDEILNLKDEYRELEGYDSNGLNPDRPIISYRHDLTYVSRLPKMTSYYKFGNFGCELSLEVVSPEEAGWAAMHAGNDWNCGIISLSDGYRLYYCVGTKNDALRTRLRELITRLFKHDPQSEAAPNLP